MMGELPQLANRDLILSTFILISISPRSITRPFRGILGSLKSIQASGSTEESLFGRLIGINKLTFYDPFSLFASDPTLRRTEFKNRRTSTAFF